MATIHNIEEKSKPANDKYSYVEHMPYHVFFENYTTWLQPEDLLSTRKQTPVWIMVSNHRFSSKEDGLIFVKTEVILSQVVDRYVHHILYDAGYCRIPDEYQELQAQMKRAEHFLHSLEKVLQLDGFTVCRGFLAYPKILKSIETTFSADWLEMYEKQEIKNELARL